MRSYVAIAFVALAVAPLTAADSASQESQGVESLGSELLDDIAPNAFDQPDSRTLDSANDPRSETHDPPSRAPRFDDLGEDIGQPSGSLSLVRVGQSMRHAESLLAATKASSDIPTLAQAGEAQTDVVAQLDKLIAELSKQCKGGQCQSGGDASKPSQRSQKKPGKSGSATGRGQTAARDSTARLDSTTAKPVDKGDLEAMVKDLWGHLPERSREQMMQSFSEEFLPKYELEIEQYYRRLSEEDDTIRPE